MQHRHLTTEGFTPAAIDDVIACGNLLDWIELANAHSPEINQHISRVCLANQDNQRHLFWLHWLGEPIHYRAPEQPSEIETSIFETRLAAPVPPEIALAVKLLSANQIADYRAFARLCHEQPAASVFELTKLDRYLPQSNGQSAIQQLLAQLAYVLPVDCAEDESVEIIRDDCKRLACQLFEQTVTLANLVTLVPVHTLSGRSLSYIDTEDIPEPYRSLFMRDMLPMSAPIIDGRQGYYAHAWIRWLTSKTLPNEKAWGYAEWEQAAAAVQIKLVDLQHMAKNVPVIERDGQPYCVMERDIPFQFLPAFKFFMYGQACPIVDDEQAYFAWDWENWLRKEARLRRHEYQPPN